ncbi:MAG: YihY/virulence factor BrkB family protein [Gemmatimonadetes bacterium]|nr:YihY/virulence factor BrkB family protein [Gemmatimonadota bacterium]
MKGAGALSMVKETFGEFMDDDSPRMAAALSYYTIFSLPPLLILIIMIAGIFIDPQDMQGRVVQQMEGAVGPQGAEQIRTMIEHANRPGSGGPLMTILSIGALVFGATGAFSQLQGALNEAWEVEKDPEKSGIVKTAMKRLLSFGMILVIAFLLLVSLILSALLSQAGSFIAGLLPGGLGEAALWAIDLGLSVVVITALFATMFKVLPDAKIAWSDVWQGALATALLFVLGKFLLSLYISRSDPGSAYGAAGSLAIILVWVYYSAMIFFLGAEFTQVYARQRGGGIQPDDDAVRVIKRTERQPPGGESAADRARG